MWIISGLAYLNEDVVAGLEAVISGDTGPALNKKRQTCPDKSAAAARDLILRPQKGDVPNESQRPNPGAWSPCSLILVLLRMWRAVVLANRNPTMARIYHDQREADKRAIRSDNILRVIGASTD